MCFIGPVIRAEVGQILLITFMNKASHPYSIQAHGVRTSTSKPEAVMPGKIKCIQRHLQGFHKMCFEHYQTLNRDLLGFPHYTCDTFLL